MRHAFSVVYSTTAPRFKKRAELAQIVRLHLKHKQDTQTAPIVKKVNEMTTDKQKEVAKENIQKDEMTSRGGAAAQPEGKKRAKPGTKGEGEYFRIAVRSKEQFTTFRYHDVGEKGHILRLAGKRSSGSWDTQVWLISKDDAHIEGDTLVPDTDDARSLIEALGSKPKHGKGDVFEAKDRPNIPESEKPTQAQKRARLKNIKKPGKLVAHTAKKE